MDFRDKLANLKAKGLFREEIICKGSDKIHPIIEGKKFINFSSNDYLGLASDSYIKKVGMKFIEEYGNSSSASRLMSGTFEIHKELEEECAKLVKKQSALIFSTGYMCNIGVITSIAKNAIIVADKLVHASIIDGIKLRGRMFFRYRHNDVEDLEKKIKKVRNSYKHDIVVITESIFSMDGDIAPIEDIISLKKKYGFFFIVDDAHMLGVYGEEGRGSIEYFKLSEEDIDITIGTFGKAIGTFGAFCAADKYVIEYIRNTARSYIYTTALPPFNVAMTLESVKHLPFLKQKRGILYNNINQFKKYFSPVYSHIIPIVIGDSKKTLEITHLLWEKNIFVRAIRPPTVPVGTSRLRVSLSASHTSEDITTFIKEIKNLNII